MIEWSNPESLLPVVAAPNKRPMNDDALRVWLSSNRNEVLQHLRVHGAILFRGLSCRTALEFEGIARVLCGDVSDYIGGNSPRTRVANHVFTSTEYAKDQYISLHNEASYLKSMPSLILFFCEEPPVDGGETPLADCRRVFNLISKVVREKFQQKGVLYVNRMHGGAGLGRSWMDVFGARNQQEVEKLLVKDGYDFKWEAGMSLRTLTCGPGVAQHPQTKENVWINQAEQWHPSSLDSSFREQLLSLLSVDELPHNAYFGDGSPLIESELKEIRAAMRAEEKVFRWQQGDILFCDNYLVMHGRRPYSGDRKILVTMG
jgi:hypothetical protein